MKDIYVQKPNIAILRSARENVLLSAISKIRKQFNDADISVISQEIYSEECQEYQVEHIVYSHKKGRYKLFGIGWKKLLELRKNKYDKIILLYNNPKGIACSNIDLLGFVIGGTNTWIFDSKSKYYPVKSFYWLINIFFRRILDTLTRVSLFILLTPFLILLILLRKIFHICQSC